MLTNEGLVPSITSGIPGRGSFHPWCKSSLGNVHIQVLIRVWGVIILFNSQILLVGRKSRLYDARDEEVLEL